MNGWLDDLLAWRDGVETVIFDAVDYLRGETVVLTDSVKRQWLDGVAQLRAKAVELDRASADLDASYDLALTTSSEAIAEWSRLRGQLDNLRSVYASALSAIETAKGTLQSVGLGALPAVAIPITLGGLAALIAASGASIAAVYSAIQAWKAYRVNQLVAAGASPADASAQVEGQYPTAAGQAWSTAIPQTVLYLALGAAAIFLFPKMLKR